MKRVTAIIIVAVAIMSGCEKEGSHPFIMKVFGDAYEDAAASVAASGGDILIAGRRTVITRRDGNYIESSDKNFGILMTSSSGGLKWERTPGGSGDDYARKVIILPGGDVIAAGFTSIGTGTATSTDIYVVRYDPTGNLLWAKALGGTGNQSAADIVAKPGGGFLIAGVTDAYRAESGAFTENIAGKKDFFLLELSETGDSVASYAFGYGGNDICVALKRDIGGGYIMYGTTDNSSQPGLGSNNLLLVRLNEDASNRGSAITGSQADEYAADIEVLPNGYLLAFTVGKEDESNQIGVIRLSTDIQAPPVFTRRFSVNSASSRVNAVEPGAGGYWYLGGRAGTPASSQALVVKIDAGGEVVGTPFLSGGTGSQEISDLVMMQSGYLAAVGKTVYENNSMMCLITLKY